MDKIIKCLSILILGMLLAGCAQENEPESGPTMPPPSDTPSATPLVGAADGTDAQEPSAAPPQETATPFFTATVPAPPTEAAALSPTPLPTATAVPEEATSTPVPLTYEPATAEPATAEPATAEPATAESPAPTETAIDTIGSRPPASGGSTADLVDRGLILDVTGVASMYAWAIEWPEPQTGLPLPAHLLMTFDNHEQAEPLARNIPRLAVFPINTYLAVARSAPGGLAMVEDQLDRLWELVETDPGVGGQPEGWMPLLPPAATPEEDWTDFARLDFVHGRGLRYLRVVNGELAYTYLGITEDGSYAITLTWPLGGADAPEAEALDAMIATLALGVPPVESS